MQGESCKYFLYLNFPLAWWGFVDKCEEKVKLQCIILSIPEHHHSLKIFRMISWIYKMQIFQEYPSTWFILSKGLPYLYCYSFLYARTYFYQNRGVNYYESEFSNLKREILLRGAKLLWIILRIVPYVICRF